MRGEPPNSSNKEARKHEAERELSLPNQVWAIFQSCNQLSGLVLSVRYLSDRHTHEGISLHSNYLLDDARDR